MTPEAVARRSAEVMWAADAASKWLGMSLDHVGPGTEIGRASCRERVCLYV